MAENDTTPPQNPPQTTPAAAPTAAPAAAKKTDGTYAQVPMGEEFDKAKWTMPPWQPVVIALVVVGIIVGIIAYFNRAKPAATGGIDEVTAVAVPGDSVMAAINVHFGNSSQYLDRKSTRL